MTYTEDTLTQQNLANCLAKDLGWESVHAQSNEDLGRSSESEVVLTRYLGEALHKLNPGLSDESCWDAIKKITETLGFQSTLQVNREKYALLRDGVLIHYYEKNGQRVPRILKVFDFDNPENNHFLCVREMWIRGPAHRRRPDLIGFVNGLPLLFVECKRPDKNLSRAYDENIADYRDTIPHIFHFNAFLMLANGVEAKIGSITTQFEHFSNWKRLAEGDAGVVDMETLVKGTCSKANFLDIFENFILFDDSVGQTAKIVTRNHQYLGVNAAFAAVQDRETREGRLGVFWHTQGSGKSYSMALFAQKVRRKLGGDFTFLILTDRQELDSQIYKTFAGVGLANNDRDPCRAESGEDLKRLLGGQHKAFVFALVQKFNQAIKAGEEYSKRSNIIVITDEAHRTQYGTLANNMRDALPNASFIGFTGTPLFQGDEITRRVFGEYVSTYDFQRAIEDKATLPLYYDPRGEKLNITSEGLNEEFAEAIAKAEIEDADTAAKLESEMRREYHIVTAQERLEHIAQDFVEHYATNWETGKAMYVAIDKITAVRMHDLIKARWLEHADKLERECKQATDEQDLLLRQRQVAWMRETKIAVVVSNEQGEVERFRKWNLDILPHRKLMADGFELADGSRLDVDTAFKREDHPFRIVIVCAMWLTGFDVPALSTLYLDKPLKAHTLMQAIARANRVKEGKNNGLIVDYCGILKHLRRALATFTGDPGGKGGSTITDPLHPEEELIAELEESIKFVRALLSSLGFELDTLIKAEGFAKNKALIDAKEAINTNDETRKRFEISARAVFRKYKACLTFKTVNKYRADYEAISFIYKILQDDRRKADTSGIVQKLHAIVDKAINVNPDREKGEKAFDISKIDFDQLYKEFEASGQKNTDIQALKQVIEARLAKMMADNPLRTDFEEHYKKIVADYNREKDESTVEDTLEAIGGYGDRKEENEKFIRDLMRLAGRLSEEGRRHIEEELEDEEQLAIFDLLRKEKLSKADIQRIKAVSAGLLGELRQYLEEVHDVFAQQNTSESFRQQIYDYLYNDITGLPTEAYNDEEIGTLTNSVYQFFRNRDSRQGRQSSG